MTEATVIRWLKKEGDRVESWQAVVELKTDKIHIETESLLTGTLLQIFAREGAVVAVGQALALIGDPNDEIGHLLAEVALANAEREIQRAEELLNRGR